MSTRGLTPWSGVGRRSCWVSRIWLILLLKASLEKGLLCVCTLGPLLLELPGKAVNSLGNIFIKRAMKRQSSKLLSCTQTHTHTHIKTNGCVFMHLQVQVHLGICVLSLLLSERRLIQSCTYSQRYNTILLKEPYNRLYFILGMFCNKILDTGHNVAVIF